MLPKSQRPRRSRPYYFIVNGEMLRLCRDGKWRDTAKHSNSKFSARTFRFRKCAERLMNKQICRCFVMEVTEREIIKPVILYPLMDFENHCLQNI